MKYHKRLLLLIVSIMLVFGLAACGSEDEPEETEPETVEEDEPEPVDPDDLLNTLDWQDDEEQILSFKDEIVTGYDITIGTAFYDTEANPDDEEESEDSDEEESDVESPYNILQWQYAEYDNTEYLLLEYSYDNDNYKVVFYKDNYANTNVAELHINLDKQEEKTDLQEWSDSVFIIEEPEPEPETVEESEPEETEPEASSSESEEQKAVDDALNFVVGKRFRVENTERVIEFTSSGQFICYGYYGSDPALGDDANYYTTYTFWADYALHKDEWQYLVNVTIDGIDYYFRYFTNGKIDLAADGGEFSSWYEPD